MIAKIPSRRILLIAFFLAFSASIALPGCAQTGSSTSESCWAEPESVLSGSMEGVEFVQGVSSYRPDLGFNELWGNADVVASGIYDNRSSSFMIQPVNGADPQYFTDFTFKDIRILKGSLSSANDAANATLIVRQRGGVGERVATANEEAASFIPKARYLLFLYRISDGSDYNTEGPHLYLIGGQMGAWEGNPDGSFLSLHNGETATEARLSARSSASPSNGAESLGARMTASERVAQLDEEYSKGELEQDYYTSAREAAQLEATTFATILSEEEAHMAEQELIDQMTELQSN